jgi:hypothetical protein
MTAFPFTNGIDINKFDETYAIVTLKDGHQHKGVIRIDASEKTQWIIVSTEAARIWVNFEKVKSLRWPISGIVRNHYYDSPGDMYHVPELYELRKQ